MTIKTTIVAAVIAIMPMAVQAQEAIGCALVGDLAEVIMANRQVGARVSEMMEIADGEPLVEALVLEAYKIPRYSSDEMQMRSVEDFRNDAEALCYRLQSDQGV